MARRHRADGWGEMETYAPSTSADWRVLNGDADAA